LVIFDDAIEPTDLRMDEKLISVNKLAALVLVAKL
jgi:hypothetical protein